MLIEYELKIDGKLTVIFNKNKVKIYEIENDILSLNDITLFVDKPEKWSEQNGELTIPCEGPSGRTEIRINHKGEVIL